MDDTTSAEIVDPTEVSDAELEEIVGGHVPSAACGGCPCQA